MKKILISNTGSYTFIDAPNSYGITITGRNADGSVEETVDEVITDLKDDEWNKLKENQNKKEIKQLIKKLAK